MKRDNMDYLTIGEGIAIQDKHLGQWKSILKPELFTKLVSLVKKDNCHAKSGHGICRGDAIYEIVANKLMVKNP